ncbi:hypothetical protein V8E52_011933 [Russula decolorans]
MPRDTGPVTVVGQGTMVIVAAVEGGGGEGGGPLAEKKKFYPSTRGHLFEELSRIPSPNFENDYVRAEESAKRDKSRKDKLRLRQRDGGGGGGGGADKDDHDDGTSFVLIISKVNYGMKTQSLWLATSGCDVNELLFAELRVPACHENCLYCKYGIHLLFDPLPVILVLAISTESCIIVVAQGLTNPRTNSEGSQARCSACTKIHLRARAHGEERIRAVGADEAPNSGVPGDTSTSTKVLLDCVGANDLVQWPRGHLGSPVYALRYDEADWGSESSDSTKIPDANNSRTAGIEERGGASQTYQADILTKNGGNGLDRITILELPSEWNLSTGMNAGHSFGNWDEYLR